MPGSGKSTVGKRLSEIYKRQFFDTDSLIEARAKKKISAIFAENGEAAFRRLESEIIAELALKNGAIISTGGGAVLSKENVDALRKNGRIYFLDRPLDAILPTSDRPLALTAEDLKKRYNERYDIYLASCDERICADCDVRDVVKKIEGSFGK